MIITYYPELTQEIRDLKFSNGEKVKSFFRKINLEYLLLEGEPNLTPLAIITLGEKYINESYKHLISPEITAFKIISYYAYNMYFYVPKTKEELTKILKLKIFA